MSAASQRVSAPTAAASSAPLPNSLRSSVNAALLANNAVPAIQSALLHECQASGFATAVRARAVDLLRSGDATTYADVLREIMAEVRGASADGGDAAALRNGEGGAEGSERKLKVPQRVIEEGVKVVRAALETCVDIET